MKLFIKQPRTVSKLPTSKYSKTNFECHACQEMKGLKKRDIDRHCSCVLGNRSLKEASSNRRHLSSFFNCLFKILWVTHCNGLHCCIIARTTPCQSLNWGPSCVESSLFRCILGLGSPFTLQFHPAFKTHEH